MARRPRIEYPGAFFHVIARGNNREDIFYDKKDRRNFLKRLAFYLDECEVTLYCFCLMTNHIHLLLEMGQNPLSQMLHRLLTWHARYHNKKYDRVGHLYQGRYKAVLCDKDGYLLELVRYIHLNPVRAGLATNPREYPWSSHKTYLGEEKLEWLNSDFVLSQFSSSISHSRILYEEFVLRRLKEGRREDLYSLADQRILGEEDFVAKVMNMNKFESTGPVARLSRFDLPTLQTAIEAELNMDRDSMLKVKRSGVQARRIFCYLAREVGRFRCKDVAAYLGKDMATVTQGVRHVTQALREGSDIRSKVDRIVNQV
jgi:REP element-mobilizing transposase RayT